MLPNIAYRGSNTELTSKLAAKMRYEGDPGPLLFAAGSMSWTRTEADQPRLTLSLTPADFEQEARQVDGTHRESTASDKYRIRRAAAGYIETLR
jgi:hypothetical protein